VLVTIKYYLIVHVLKINCHPVSQANNLKQACCQRRQRPSVRACIWLASRGRRHRHKVTTATEEFPDADVAGIEGVPGVEQIQRQPSLCRKACTKNSCTNGWRTTLKVPSRNHVRARARSRSWSGVANRRCLPSSTCTSVCRKSGPMKSTSRSKSRDVGSVGRSFSRLRFVARLRLSMCGRLAGGASAVASASCARTLSMTAPADAKMSSVAF